MIAYLIQDMLFSSKVREVAKQLGFTTKGTRDVAAFVEAARGARLAIVDLRLPQALAALEALAADPAARAVPSVGFIDHELTDVMEAARSRGCGEVLAKGAFANRLPKILGDLALAAP